jgi:hypothetical protein
MAEAQAGEVGTIRARARQTSATPRPAGKHGVIPTAGGATAIRFDDGKHGKCPVIRIPNRWPRVRIAPTALAARRLG